MTTTLPLPAGARLRVERADDAPLALCTLSALQGQRGVVALEWTEAARAAEDDAGANLVVRQAPFTRGVHRVGRPDLDGLPGFLADSMPDAWGRLLVDRQLRQAGLQPASLRGIDRLAIVGARGPGALTYAPEVPLGDDDAGGEHFDLDRLARGAALVLEGEAPDVLDALQRAGGSAGGSRPKVWAALSEAGTLRSGAHGLRAGECGWLIKFRAPKSDPEDVGQLEYAYALMARAAGIDIAEPRLFVSTSGARYFGSRRFDREGPRRIHVRTVAGFLNVAPEVATAQDYADLLAIVAHVTRSDADVMAMFRVAAFNVLAHNRDDHLKQFAFRWRDGRWRLAPAYDLTFSAGPGGEHTLLVAGEGRAPGVAHLRELAERRRLKTRAVNRILDDVRAAIAEWPTHAANAGVSEASTAQVRTTLAELAARR